jgi:hypothetical protein
MIKKVLLTIIVVVMLYLIFNKLLPYLSDKYYPCSIYEIVYNQQIHASIDKKFIDAPNHNYRTIVYSEKNIKQTLTMDGEFQEIYFYLNVGDSLIKEKGSINYRIVYKKTGKDTILKFETNCKDSVEKSK